jgi:hypothetical protein
MHTPKTGEEARAEIQVTEMARRKCPPPGAPETQAVRHWGEVNRTDETSTRRIEERMGSLRTGGLGGHVGRKTDLVLQETVGEEGNDQTCSQCEKYQRFRSFVHVV